MSATDPALMSAEELLGHYARHALSPVEVLKAVTERIARYNPEINAFAVMSPHSLKQAGESEARWRAGRPRGLLDGVPVTVKDVIDLAGFPTRRGSRLTDPAPVADDAPVALSLKEHGAVIVGKTTTTEFGWKSPGDCPLHGITRNPWNKLHTPGGSSSGAAAAAAAAFGPLHVGTDGGGSVRIPAAWCGVVGLKPSFGRVPQWPLGAFANLAVAGPLARTVRDAALMLSVMARHDLRDPFCLPEEPRDWRNGIEEGVAELRIAVLRRPGFEAPVDWEGIAAVEQAAQLLSEAGAEVEEVDPGLPDTRAVFCRVWGVALTRLVQSFPETRRHMLDAGLLAVAAANDGVPATALMEMEELRITAAHAMARLHQRYDLVLCPTVPGMSPLVDAPLGDPMEAVWNAWAPWTFPFSLTRQPAITVPMGLSGNGLPRSVQLAAAQYRDDLVLRAARTLEVAQPFAMPELG
ncbi:Amidase [Rhodovastum atsumiense]|uniref:Amidase n=1 Tax=Rhodovastum atsumiense TaxID=504468 RepID=A0A5M6ILT9_9PROT|nr:amidase [Rhodovastum atsumiense]KAA5609246.1 amidase [Rhodovastum atsumiense]CAH2601698.1 Amidase [Rhodovastum atsumiense]